MSFYSVQVRIVEIFSNEVGEPPVSREDDSFAIFRDTRGEAIHFAMKLLQVELPPPNYDELVAAISPSRPRRKPAVDGD